VTQGEDRKRMPFIDPEGRLFGRVNVFDAMVIAFAIVLVPLAYGSYLLFRSPAVHITSVTRVPITREERRVAGGSTLAAKIKVHGTGLRPLLRASIGDTPAIALVFEDAHSADVLVGEVPPGTHDLVLFDGVQEVARAPKSVTIQPEPTQHVLAIGALTFADRASADAAAPGVISRVAEVVLLGATRIDAGGVHRDAEIRFECDPDPSGEGCSVDSTLLTTPRPVVHVTTSAGHVWSFAVRELLPTTPPQRTTARVRFTGPDEVLRRLRAGARDDCLDARAAAVADVDAVRGVGSTPSRDATLTLGIDRTAAGWSYRGRVFKVGAPFTLATEQYVIEGVVLTTGVEDASR